MAVTRYAASNSPAPRRLCHNLTPNNRPLAATQCGEAEQRGAEQREGAGLGNGLLLDQVIANHVERRDLIRSQGRSRTRRANRVLYPKCPTGVPIPVVRAPPA